MSQPAFLQNFAIVLSIAFFFFGSSMALPQLMSWWSQTRIFALRSKLYQLALTRPEIVHARLYRTTEASLNLMIWSIRNAPGRRYSLLFAGAFVQGWLNGKRKSRSKNESEPQANGSAKELLAGVDASEALRIIGLFERGIGALGWFLAFGSWKYTPLVVLTMPVWIGPLALLSVLNRPSPNDLSEEVAATARFKRGVRRVSDLSIKTAELRFRLA